MFGKIVRIIPGKNGTWYLYNVLSNKIYTYTGKMNQKDISPEEMERRLAANLCGEDVIDRIAWSRPFQEYLGIIDKKIPKLLLEITKRCNLDCQYCIYSGKYSNMFPHADVDMSPAVMKASIDLFVRHNKDCESADIGFYGGEPLIHTELIASGIAYSKKMLSGKRVRFTISSNGVLINDELLTILRENREVELIVTMNGPFHDDYRIDADGNGSYQRILANFARIKKEYPDLWEYQIRMISNITSLDQLGPLEPFYQKLGKYPDSITYISTDNVADESLKRIIEPCAAERDTWQKKSREYMEAKNRAFQILVRDGIRVIHERKIFTEKTGLIGSCFPFENKIFVQANGNLGICESVSNYFSFGTIFDGFEYGKIELLYNAILLITNKQCRECWAQRLCQVCIRDVVTPTGIVERIPAEKCERFQRNAIRLLYLFCNYHMEFNKNV